MGVAGTLTVGKGVLGLATVIPDSTGANQCIKGLGVITAKVTMPRRLLRKPSALNYLCGTPPVAEQGGADGKTETQASEVEYGYLVTNLPDRFLDAWYGNSEEAKPSHMKLFQFISLRRYFRHILPLWAHRRLVEPWVHWRDYGMYKDLNLIRDSDLCADMMYSGHTLHIIGSLIAILHAAWRVWMNSRLKHGSHNGESLPLLPDDPGKGSNCLPNLIGMAVKKYKIFGFCWFVGACLVHGSIAILGICVIFETRFHYSSDVIIAGTLTPFFLLFLSFSLVDRSLC